MGACGSREASNEDSEQKKRSQAIDKKLEEDSRRLRRECKILLLGRYNLNRSCGRETVTDANAQGLGRAANRRL